MPQLDRLATPRSQSGAWACGRIDLEIGDGHLIMAGSVDLIVAAALVAALRAP